VSQTAIKEIKQEILNSRKCEGVNLFYATGSGLSTHGGRAIAQVVSRRLPTAAARVRARFRSCGICGS
jgi:hypothetical protein